MTLADQQLPNIMAGLSKIRKSLLTKALDPSMYDILCPHATTQPTHKLCLDDMQVFLCPSCIDILLFQRPFQTFMWPMHYAIN